MDKTRPDTLRVWLTFGIALAGIMVVLVAFLAAIEKFGHSHNPAEIITAVLGPVIGVVGTLAGYVAGQAAGAAGKEKADEKVADVQKKLQAVLDVAPEKTLERAKSVHKDSF